MLFFEWSYHRENKFNLFIICLSLHCYNPYFYNINLQFNKSNFQLAINVQRRILIKLIGGFQEDFISIAQGKVVIKLRDRLSWRIDSFNVEELRVNCMENYQGKLYERED
jgi:hypothetical protein